MTQVDSLPSSAASPSARPIITRVLPSPSSASSQQRQQQQYPSPANNADVLDYHSNPYSVAASASSQYHQRYPGMTTSSNGRANSTTPSPLGLPTTTAASDQQVSKTAIGIGSGYSRTQQQQQQQQNDPVYKKVLRREPTYPLPPKSQFPLGKKKH